MRKALLLEVFMAIIVAMLAMGCVSTGAKDTGQGQIKGGRDARLGAYPEAQYLRAVGIGQTEPEARNRAISEISRIFVSRVKAEAVDTAKSTMVNGSEVLQETMESRIEVVSDMELEGAEVPEVWQEGATHYAIAVLDRQKAAKGWIASVEDIDRRIQAHLGAAGQQDSRLLRYNELRKVMTLWAERAVYASRLNVIGHPAPVSAKSRVSAAMDELASLKSQMRLYLDISGGGALADGLAQDLGKSGLILTGNRSEADVLITGSVQVRRLDMDSKDWVYARAMAEISVSDARTGAVVGTVPGNVRSANLSYDEAAGKAIKKLTPKITEGIIKLLNE